MEDNDNDQFAGWDYPSESDSKQGFCESCEKPHTLIECYVPDSDAVENLCLECAYEQGYCQGCGTFWAGVEKFDFSRIKGFCPNCVDQIESDMADEDEDWDDDEDDWKYTDEIDED